MKRVRVYFNLHKRLFSVQEKGEKGWRVIGHTNNITLKDVRFKVNEAGRQRVLKEKRKNVHAYVEGYVSHDSFDCKSPMRVKYNPYRAGSFTCGPFSVKEAGTVNLSCPEGKAMMQTDYCYMP